MLIIRNRDRNRGSARNAHHRVTKDTKDQFFIDPQLTINYQRILDLEPSNLRIRKPSNSSMTITITITNDDYDYDYDDDYDDEYEHEI